MNKNKEYKLLYLVAIIAVITISLLGSTYAYLTATTISIENDVNTSSTSYSISMDITPIYSGFSMIPMNDEYALKGINNKCKDKFDRGVCQAYSIRVYDYAENLDYVSGYMDVETDNISNLSYMVFGPSDTFDEEKCINIENKYYCKSIEQTPTGEGQNLSLGDSYNVEGKKDTNIVLLIWLTNLNKSQNNEDIGNFNTTVTMQAGNGGEIKGTIASALILDDGQEGGSDNG